MPQDRDSVDQVCKHNHRGLARPRWSRTQALPGAGARIAAPKAPATPRIGLAAAHADPAVAPVYEAPRERRGPAGPLREPPSRATPCAHRSSAAHFPELRRWDGCCSRPCPSLTTALNASRTLHASDWHVGEGGVRDQQLCHGEKTPRTPGPAPIRCMSAPWPYRRPGRISSELCAFDSWGYANDR